jgi:hypothetical protein
MSIATFNNMSDVSVYLKESTKAIYAMLRSKNYSTYESKSNVMTFLVWFHDLNRLILKNKEKEAIELAKEISRDFGVPTYEKEFYNTFADEMQKKFNTPMIHGRYAAFDAIIDKHV